MVNPQLDDIIGQDEVMFVIANSSGEPNGRQPNASATRNLCGCPTVTAEPPQFCCNVTTTPSRAGAKRHAAQKGDAASRPAKRFATKSVSVAPGADVLSSNGWWRFHCAAAVVPGLG